MAYQTPRACPVCGREMRPSGLFKHARVHELTERERITVPLELQAEMVHLYRAGYSMERIGRDLFWSKTTVRMVLLANGVTLRRRGGFNRRQITAEEQLRRAQLYGQGYSLSEVAEMCGVALSTVHYSLQVLGTPRRSRSEANRIAQRKRQRALRLAAREQVGQ